MDVLVGKTIQAARRLGLRCVTASGGVLCNRELRRRLGEACAARGLKLRLAEPRFCTDNAGMIGILAERKLRRGEASADLDEEIAPAWNLGEAPTVRAS
jgi:N6-L-threonylcarbamoyladenine synthase